MRVKEIADLAGTTPRAVRYYHELGLLPVPDNTGFRRDYGLVHLARLLRIRWLVDSGVGLESVKEILASEDAHDTADDQGSTMSDLEATRDQIDAKIVQLRNQRRRINELIERASSKERLSPIPQTLENFYTDIEQRMSSPSGIQLLRDKKHIMMFLMTSKMFPGNAIDLFLTDFDEEERAVCADAYLRFAALKTSDPGSDGARAAADALEEELWDLFNRHRHSSLELFAHMPSGRISAGLWAVYEPLSRLIYAHPLQKAVFDGVLQRFAADPLYADLLDDSVRKKWLHAGQPD